MGMGDYGQEMMDGDDGMLEGMEHDGQGGYDDMGDEYGQEDEESLNFEGDE